MVVPQTGGRLDTRRTLAYGSSERSSLGVLGYSVLGYQPLYIPSTCI
jgi:hypothetical protein